MEEQAMQIGQIQMVMIQMAPMTTIMMARRKMKKTARQSQASLPHLQCLPAPSISNQARLIQHQAPS